MVPNILLILKYNSDFLVYTDVDTNVEIKDFDRFHVFLSTGGPLVEASLEEMNQNQPHTNRGEDSQPLQSLLMKKAPQILQEYKTTGFVSMQSRKLLVKTCIGDLVERCGFYPLNGDKLALAKSIIATFPSLSVQVAGQGEGFLDSEFGRFTGEKADLFLRKWEANIIPKLKAVAAMEPGLCTLLKGIEDMTEDEACYTMLVLLTHLLSPVGVSHCSAKTTITNLLDFVLPGTRIASLCSDSSTSSTNHQPQVICIGDLRSLKQYVIVAKNDKVTIPLDDGLKCAVDKLFKLYWVCNLSYPPPLCPVFTFFEYIYDLPFSTQRKAKVLELIAQLKACK
ncbi:hypothetical protein ILYODFUR_012042 [Ilyodon furcidens]|uniref:Uncharacterized protein n=1 Tax=Ilyodon furcidens TaxID=33524 RepID=A0ABV0UFH8_9TELE